LSLALSAPTLDLAELVESVASQPDLFSAAGVPLFSAEDAQLLKAPAAMGKRADADRYSGRQASSDERRCLVIAALVMMGRSKNDIAATVGCDKRLIRPVVERLENEGLLPPLERRVTRAQAELREETLTWLGELVDARTVDRDTAAMLRGLFTGAGILADKQAAADGSGGVNVTVQIGVAAGPDPGGWRAQVRSVGASGAGTPETDSGAIHCTATACAGDAAGDAGVDASAPGSPIGAGLHEGGPDRGRGGSRSSAGASNGDGLPPEIIHHREAGAPQPGPDGSTP
jgi:hypothetical protein